MCMGMGCAVVILTEWRSWYGDWVVGWTKLESGVNSLRRQDISLVLACLDRLLGPSGLPYDVEVSVFSVVYNRFCLPGSIGRAV